MTRYFLGFIPDEQSNYKIRKIVGEIGRVFTGQDVSVKWVDPDSFHITLVYLGETMSFISKFILMWKLRKLQSQKIRVRLEKANVGISRNQREIVYLSLLEGADSMRDVLYKLGMWDIRSKSFENFIPHITLGRINKDLSNEEFSNLQIDVRNINPTLNADQVSFDIDKLHLIKSENGVISFVDTVALK